MMKERVLYNSRSSGKRWYVTKGRNVGLTTVDWQSEIEDIEDIRRIARVNARQNLLDQKIII